MAITFSKSISETDIINAFNNNIVIFESDNVLDSLYCEIDINGSIFRITPNSDNVFRDNLGGNRSKFSVLVNQNDFSDDVVLSINTGDVNSLIVDDTSNSYLDADITYTITFSNLTTENTGKKYKVLKSVQQEQNYQVLSTSVDEFHFLTPSNKINYFLGYPLSVGYYLDSDATITLENQATLTISVDFTETVGRLQISDGEETIEEFLTLQENDFILTDTAVPKTLNLIKKDQCGEYIKFINRFGQWNYWLFNNKSKHILSTSNESEIFNDFDNVNENISPTLQIGKQGIKSLNLHSSNVQQYEMDYLIDLFVSPKVYYYTGEKDTAESLNSWLEVKFKGQSTTIKDYKATTYNINAVIELPKLNTMML